MPIFRPLEYPKFDLPLDRWHWPPAHPVGVSDVPFEMPLQKSSTSTLTPDGWETAEQNLRATFPKTATKEFYRLVLPE